MHLHWSHRLSTANPRGYSDHELHLIRHAASAAARRGVELQIVAGRLEAEKQRVYPIDDEYGVERMEKMAKEVEEEYDSGRCSYRYEPGGDNDDERREEVTPQSDSVSEVVAERLDPGCTEVVEAVSRSVEAKVGVACAADAPGNVKGSAKDKDNAKSNDNTNTNTNTEDNNKAKTKRKNKKKNKNKNKDKSIATSAPTPPTTQVQSSMLRNSKHWSRRITEKNPRGYSQPQQNILAKCKTIRNRYRTEKHCIQARIEAERARDPRVDDAYGLEALEAMLAAVHAQYAETVAEAAEAVKAAAALHGVEPAKNQTEAVADRTAALTAEAPAKERRGGDGVAMEGGPGLTVDRSVVRGPAPAPSLLSMPLPPPAQCGDDRQPVSASSTVGTVVAKSAGLGENLTGVSTTSSRAPPAMHTSSTRLQAMLDEYAEDEAMMDDLYDFDMYEMPDLIPSSPISPRRPA
jgi:hypothetical protein